MLARLSSVASFAASRSTASVAPVCAVALPAAAAAASAWSAAAAAVPSRSLHARAAARPLHFEAATAAASSTDAAADAAAAAPAAASPVPADSRPVSTRQFTKATLRRQALAQAQPWYISATQLQHLRKGGFDGPITKLPAEQRGWKPEGEMKRLRHQEAARLASDARRVICNFGPGDKIVVSKYLSLNDRTKFERIGGLCLARSKGDRLTAAFIMRSTKLGEDYELRFPLWSPFIARIDMIQPRAEGPSRTKKLYRLREEEPTAWEVKVPQGLPKPTAEPQSIDHRAKTSGGKVVILSHKPMKKQIKEKRAGGIGAEMAAAGGAPAKGGAKPAAAAPKKK